MSTYNHCTGYLRFTANDKYKQDHNSFKPVTDLLSTVPSYVGNGYTGLQEEDGSTGYFISTWKSYSDHIQLFGSDIDPELKKRLDQISTGPRKLFHCYLNRPYVPAASKPVTEFAEFILRPGVDKKAALDVMKKLWEWMDTNHSVDGAYGPLVEDINYYLFLIGWDSLEEHKKHGPPKDLLQEANKYWDHDHKNVNVRLSAPK